MTYEFQSSNLLRHVDKDIVIVGCGIIGLTTAFQLIKDGFPPHRLQIVAKSKGYDTTSYVSGALWESPPFAVFPKDKAMEWCHDTLKELNELIKLDPSCGIHVVPNITVSSTPLLTNDSVKHMKSYTESKRILLNNDLSHAFQQFSNAQSYDAPIADMPVYLSWLEQQLIKKKVSFHIPFLVHSLDELTSPNRIVINCTGLSSYTLVSDYSMYPVQGQVVRIWAPWIKCAMYSKDNDAYIIPRPKGDVICGGTKRENQWSTNINTKDTQNIINQCATMIPSIQNALIIDERVGLRPQRQNGIRIEWDNSKKLLHHYGHGGSGFACSWGTAKQVSKLIQTIFQVKSRL